MAGNDHTHVRFSLSEKDREEYRKAAALAHPIDRSTGSSFTSPPISEGRQYFTFSFQILRIKHVPSSFKGELYVKWSRGKASDKTESAQVSDQVLTWSNPPTSTFSTSLKNKGGEWGTKTVTFTLKQIKKGWGTAKDVGRLKLHLGEFVGDKGKIHGLVMSSSFSPPPIFEFLATVQVDSDRNPDDDSEMSLAEGDETEGRTWDTVSLADLSEGEGNANLAELRKKYDTLRRRAFQLRDALIKWQNYANKLKDNNQFLDNRIIELEKGKEKGEREGKELKETLVNLEKEFKTAQKDLEDCQKDLEKTLSSLSQEKSEKKTLKEKVKEGDVGKSGVEEAKGKAARVTEVYETQKIQLQEKEKEAKKLKKLQKEKDEEIARLTASLNQSLKARAPGVHNAHSSLVTSIIGLLVLILAGMFYTSMTSRS